MKQMTDSELMALARVGAQAELERIARHFMSARERQAVSVRMRKYWAERRKANGKTK